MMKKHTLLLLFIILGIFTTATLLFLRYEWEIQKDILYVKNSRIVISEETWEGENLVYYQQNGCTKIISKDKIEYIGYGDASETTNGQKFLSRYETLAKEKLKELTPSDNARIDRIKNWFQIQ